MKYIFLAIMYFCSSYIIEAKINNLEKLMYVTYAITMLSCGALARSNNSHTKLSVKLCLSKGQKETFAMWV